MILGHFGPFLTTFWTPFARTRQTTTNMIYLAHIERGFLIQYIPSSQYLPKPPKPVKKGSKRGPKPGLGPQKQWFWPPFLGDRQKWHFFGPFFAPFSKKHKKITFFGGILKNAFLAWPKVDDLEIGFDQNLHVWKSQNGPKPNRFWNSSTASG